MQFVRNVQDRIRIFISIAVLYSIYEEGTLLCSSRIGSFPYYWISIAEWVIVASIVVVIRDRGESNNNSRWKSNLTLQIELEIGHQNHSIHK